MSGACTASVPPLDRAQACRYSTLSSAGSFLFFGEGIPLLPINHPPKAPCGRIAACRLTISRGASAALKLSFQDRKTAVTDFARGRNGLKSVPFWSDPPESDGWPEEVKPLPCHKSCGRFRRGFPPLQRGRNQYSCRVRGVLLSGSFSSSDVPSSTMRQVSFLSTS